MDPNKNFLPSISYHMEMAFIYLKSNMPMHLITPQTKYVVKSLNSIPLLMYFTIINYLRIRGINQASVTSKVNQPLDRVIRNIF